MLTNCLAACAHLTITLSEIQRDICEKIVILSYPLAFDAPVRGSRRNIGTPFGMEKLEWCRYPKVKNFEDMFIRFDVIHERNRRTDRRTNGRTLHDSIDRACIASRGKNGFIHRGALGKPLSEVRTLYKVPSSFVSDHAANVIWENRKHLFFLT